MERARPTQTVPRFMPCSKIAAIAA
jgi:hypothetical protein